MSPTSSCTKARVSARPALPRPHCHGLSLRWQRATRLDARPTSRRACGAELDFNQGEATYPFGAHIAVVEVDTETGRVELLRHVAVDDCGRVINPLLVAGQQHGGIAQGVAQALYEGVLYDDDGNPLTANLMDYAMPSAAELPSFEASNTETPTPLNPLGAKGIGEAGTIGSTPAAQNAVVDALSIFGIRHLDMPLTSERVWQAIRDAADHRLTPHGLRVPDAPAHAGPVPRDRRATATTACPTKRAACSSGPWSTTSRAATVTRGAAVPERRRVGPDVPARQS